MSNVESALNRVTKWRSIFAGWQLGTRAKGDPESDAVRDHRELTILLRVELTALAGLLIKKGVFTAEEFEAALAKEADWLDLAFARKFPGLRATDDGIEIYDTAKAHHTMRGWRP
jgi:hypothetical protein